jgi:hypothetical protein
MSCTKWALPLHKREADEIVTTLEFGTSDFDDNNASVDSELEHESGTSEPEPVGITSKGKSGKQK